MLFFKHVLIARDMIDKKQFWIIHGQFRCGVRFEQHTLGRDYK